MLSALTDIIITFLHYRPIESYCVLILCLLNAYIYIYIYKHRIHPIKCTYIQPTTYLPYSVTYWHGTLPMHLILERIILLNKYCIVQSFGKGKF